MPDKPIITIESQSPTLNQNESKFLSDRGCQDAAAKKAKHDELLDSLIFQAIHNPPPY